MTTLRETLRRIPRLPAITEGITSLRRIPRLPAIILGATSLIILIVMNPALILSSTTPTGGDMGAHVFGPAYLRDTLLPQGRILGWSNDWFAGFPAFYFYFPLPSLVIVFLDLFLPYGVAFKIVTVLGLVALAPAIYFHARTIGIGRHISLIAAGSGAVFAFYESYSIYGGNIASSLAGEFSYSWSFALSIVYLTLLIKAVRDDRKYLKWAALALALTALSHILTTIVVIFASLFVLFWKKGPARTFLIWFWGFAIAAFWALPLVMRIGLTSDMGWTPLSRWEEIFPVELWLLLPVAIPGAVWAVRRTNRVIPILAATLLPVIYYPLPLILPKLAPGLFGGDRWKLWNGRLLPYWYFGVAFFAALGLGVGIMWLSRRLPSRVPTHFARGFIAISFAVATGLVIDSTEFPSWAWIVVVAAGVAALAATFLFASTVNTRNFLTTTAAAIVVLGATAGVTFVDGWSKWNYEGYESKAPWPEYEALMEELDRLPEGRVQWESNSDLNKYGTPMSPMLIPYWTEGSHQSMEGLYFESSLTTPFHFINHSEMSFKPSNPIPGLKYHTFDMARGLQHMDVYGVDYYVSFTPEAAEKANEIEGFTEIAVTEPFHIFRLPETELVEPATHLPAVYDVPERGLLSSLIGSGTVTGPDGEPLPSFHDLSLEWYEDIENIDRWVVADGPEDWPRIQALDERPDVELDVPPGAVSDIVVDDHRISFSTKAVGVPHLVKVSYFPNWRATGAEGPWRASPSLMVVVPTEEEVVLEFRDTWPESLGKVLSLGGVVTLVAVVIVARRPDEPETVTSSREDPAS
ncbi:MAG TPA: hypothetical protein VFO17_12450 [Acidimicrobiia bacterium]|nr:hypothetical protein [Acidimicrobiia bacterium]